MKTRIGLATLAALGLAAVTAIPAHTKETAGIHDKRGTKTFDCVNSLTGAVEGTFLYEGPIVAWPPNHKYRNATVTLTDTDAETLFDGVTVAVTGTHDEFIDGEELNGSGNTGADFVPGAGTGEGSATAPFKLRGERSGRGDGRTYTITLNGTTDSETSTCEAVSFTVTVPHDMRDKPLA